MFSLILTIISIAIFSVLLSAGASYIDSDSVMAKRDTMNTKSTIINIGMGLTSFRNLMGVEATDVNQLTPAFAHTDELPDYISLIDVGNDTYRSKPNSRYACFSAAITNTVQFQSISRLNNEFFADNLIFASDCSQTTEDVVFSPSKTTIIFKYYY